MKFIIIISTIQDFHNHLEGYRTKIVVSCRLLTFELILLYTWLFHKYNQGIWYFHCFNSKLHTKHITVIISCCDGLWEKVKCEIFNRYSTCFRSTDAIFCYSTLLFLNFGSRKQYLPVFESVFLLLISKRIVKPYIQLIYQTASQVFNKKFIEIQ